MSFLDTLQEMLVILFAIAVGYTANRLGYLNADTNQRLSKILLNLTTPAMIIATVITGDTLPGIDVILSILRVSVIFYGLEFLFALTVPRFLGGTPKQKGVWRDALAFPNVGFIGYPVAVALFGQGALFYAVILVLPFNLLTYTLGPLILGGGAKFSLKKMFSPCVTASILSLVLALSHYQPPALIGECLDFVGDITVPLALVTVGSLLAGLPVGRVFTDLRIWALSILRLLVLPVLLCLVLRALNVDSLVLGIAVTQMAMPVAVNGSLLCMEYGGDTECMAQATLLTTAGSILTIPLIAAMLL